MVIKGAQALWRSTSDLLRNPQQVVELFREVSVKSWIEIEETGSMLNTLRKIAMGRETSEQERREALEQAKDVARTVPAFGIFLLPGGALLLPLVARIVPWRLLPSAFDGGLNSNEKQYSMSDNQSSVLAGKECPATPRKPLQEPPIVEIQPLAPLVDYAEARAIADAEAERRLESVMLLSWYDRDRDFESPQHASECHQGGDIPGYVDFGINHGAELKVDIESGRFVFYYLSA
jgi:hypothetical protein